MPALVVSGHTMALAVVRALGEAGVPVAVLHYDPRDIAHTSKYAIADIRSPDPMHDEPGFVEALLQASRRFGGSVLIPASDESTVAVSRNLDMLARHYTVAATDWAITERFIDKSRTYALADAHGIPAPRTLVPSSEEDLASQAESIGFPLLLKPAVGHRFYARFKRKMVRAETWTVLVAAYRQAVEAGLSMMVQEIIDGDDDAIVNYNSYTWDGRPLAEFTARQLRKAPPGFGSPRVAISEWIPEVVEPGRRILAAMEFRGFSCSEFKLDRRDGTYKLMEVNGRHNLSGLLAVRCGLNFPLMQYRHLAEGVIPTGGRYTEGLYWTDVVRDVAYSLAYLWKERYSPVRYARPYARRHCDAIFDGRDMAPFRARLRYLLRIRAGGARALIRNT